MQKTPKNANKANGDQQTDRQTDGPMDGPTNQHSGS